MAVPPIIFAVCLVVGAVGATVWLPALEAGPVGGLAFFTVCGLIGAGLGLIGLHVYAMIETAETGRFARVLIADQLTGMLFEAGVVLGLGIAIYLLVPRAAARPTDTAD
jgi:hypothetical protein